MPGTFIQELTPGRYWLDSEGVVREGDYRTVVIPQLDPGGGPGNTDRIVGYTNAMGEPVKETGQSIYETTIEGHTFYYDWNTGKVKYPEGLTPTRIHGILNRNPTAGGGIPQPWDPGDPKQEIWKAWIPSTDWGAMGTIGAIATAATNGPPEVNKDPINEKIASYTDPGAQRAYQREYEGLPPETPAQAQAALGISPEATVSPVTTTSPAAVATTTEPHVATTAPTDVPVKRRPKAKTLLTDTRYTLAPAVVYSPSLLGGTPAQLGT